MDFLGIRRAPARQPILGRRPPSLRQNPLRLERLEPRLMLDAGPLLISELMAVNNQTLPDGDGAYPDWVEIHNPTSTPVDLEGWYLTDDATNLTKWPFPAHALAPDEYLTVFASDKYPNAPAGELHTNFKLSSDGEYLALVHGDGVTISHDYAPAFPPQAADVSYGITQDATTLVAEGDPLSYLVPTAPVAGWTETAFDDSGWTDTVAVDEAGLLITEVATGDVRLIEIQNVSTRSLDTSGWRVLANDATAANVSAVHAAGWSLPGSMAAGEILYGTDDPANPGDHYFGGPIHWDPEGPGWTMILDDTGEVVDFVAWGYSDAQLAALRFDYAGFSDVTVAEAWRGDGADVGSVGAGAVEGFLAYNDHIAGTGTHANATTFAANGTRSGTLEDITTGAATGVTLATSHSGANFESQTGTPAAGTDAHDLFDGFVDFRSGGGASVAISGADTYTHAFSGLDTGNDVTYNLSATAVRGRSGYTDRWAQVTLIGADAATPAHSTGNGIIVLSPTEVAVWVGENHRAGQGFVAAWTAIDPGSDGQFSIVSRQYRGSTPGVGDGTADGSKGYAMAGLRLQEVVPAGPASWLRRMGNFDGNSADDFVRARSATQGQQDPDLDVPFATITPAVTGVGFSDGAVEFESLIRTDVAAAMQGTSASLLTRIEFEVDGADLPQYDLLSLWMKYDDGFAAYLNGTPIAAENAPPTPVFNATATDAHPNEQAVVYEHFNVNDHLGALRPGTNVLAIQGLNVTAADGDLLIVPELVAAKTRDVERYFATPTPGTANHTGFEAYVEDTQFSVDRGFYDAPQQVAVTTITPGATIYYTLDGSRPTESTGIEYTGPITVDRTTTLRAAAFRPGYAPTNVDTQTYVLLDDVPDQSPLGQPPGAGWPAATVNGQAIDYGMDPQIVGSGTWGPQLDVALQALPTLSLVTDLEHLFDPATGIYVNANGRGEAWERAASLELLEPSGAEGFQIDAGLRIRGGTGREAANPKHAFRLFFRSEYGNPQLTYPLFGNQGTDQFQKLDLRTAESFSWAYDVAGGNAQTMLRDVFARDTLAAMGQESTRSRYYHLYLNGQYWGIYQTEERPEAAFGETYFGGDRDDYDVIKVDGGPGRTHTIEATDGNLDAWNDLWQTAATGFGTDAAYYHAQGLDPVTGQRDPAYEVLLDVDNLIDYMLVVFYTGDGDAPISSLLGDDSPNNFFAVRNRFGDEGFRFFNRNAEHTLSQGETDRTGPFTTGDTFERSNPQWLHQQLMEHPEYRLRFADRVGHHLFHGGPLSPDAAAERYAARADEIDAAIVAESARWGDAQQATPYDKDDWQAAVDQDLTGFFPGRTQTVFDQLGNTTLRDGTPAPLYPTIAAPAFSINATPQHGGDISVGGTLTIAAAGTIYYTLDGTDPRLPGGAVAPTAVAYGGGITLSASTLVKARVQSGGEWSAVSAAQFYAGTPATAANLGVTELNYNPHDPTPNELAVAPPVGNDDFEFVELVNLSPSETIDLTGVEFTGGIRFSFVGYAARPLQPGERVVVVRDAEAFRLRYGDDVPVAGVYTGALDNGGEQITLRDRFGQVIDDFRYNDAGDWPARPDGGGSSLTVAYTAGDYNDAANWRSSLAYGGTPGTARLAIAPDVVINEVLSDPISPAVDAIELYNVADHPTDVSGWLLSDSSDDYHKFTIPADTILPAGAFAVFDAAALGFGLDAGGDNVWLLATDVSGRPTHFADHVQFGGALPGVSFGRAPDGTGELVMMSQVTLGTANATPRAGQVVINELHVRPVTKTQPVEYLELFNRGGDPVDLSGWYFDNGIDYTFPGGTVLAAGGYLVVAQDKAAVDAKFGVNAVGQYRDKLANDGERLALRDAAGVLQDEVEYGLTFPWPTVGDPLDNSLDPPGASMELVHPDLDNNLPGSWRSSSGTAVTQQTLIPDGSRWKYFKGTAAPSAGGQWRELGFNDAAWDEGTAALGYSGQDAERDFIETTLDDMSGTYSTVYLRKTFTVDDLSQANSLLLDVQYDDGINVWINGSHVRGLNVSADELPHTATADDAIDNREFVPLTLTNPGAYLRQGENVIAVQLLNQSLGGSSDAFFDAELRTSSGGAAGVTPGARNSVYSTNAPPAMQQVEHSPNQPTSAESVTITIEATDTDGVASLALHYQVVAPGDYINIADPRYENAAYWTTVAMADNGTGGDAFAGDGVYTAVVPPQANRTLMRYRITARDTLGASITVPYADDPQPNFAYYVYDGVPSWTGSARPGVSPAVEYDSELLTSIPVYTLLTVRQDHLDALHVPYRSGQADQQTPQTGSYGGSQYKWQGTLVYDGEVYDHIRYRARGGVWRYSMGKNMWKFDFNRGHYFQAKDDYGNDYGFKWDKLNFSALIQQGNFRQRGEQGLFEAAGFKLHNLAGNPAPNTSYVHFRVVEDGSEGGPDQYSTDFQGLYLNIEQPDGRLLDQHGLPDGNYYKMEGGTGTLNNQGPTHPENKADLNAFMNAYKNNPGADWFKANLDLQEYYSFRAIAMAIHDYDIHAGKNYFYYHNPETGKWAVHNWDLDLCWTTTYNGGGGRGPLNQYVFAIPEFVVGYNNRLREIRDLLFNPEQTGMLLDEVAQVVYTPGEQSFVDADRAMWDYNPILTSSYINSSKASHGRYYQAVGSRSFAGMLQYQKNYVAGRMNSIDPQVASDDHLAPYRPTVSYVGAEGFPADGLAFESSTFSSPQGRSFAAMQWRIARASDPADPDFDFSEPPHYEIAATWQSEELTTFDDTITIPGDGLDIGETYRVRVRMKDDAGRYSHWSQPVQLVVGDPTGRVRDALRITEINYNPADPTAAELATQPVEDPDFTAADFEFVELTNISDGPIVDLAGVRFGEGIEFDFTGGPIASLAAGESLVIVQNEDAFAARYGDGAAVAGTFTNRLNNGGERLLLLDKFGQTILDFSYSDDDAWPQRADGEGSSLELVDLNTPPTRFDEGDRWRDSREYGGSPGWPGDSTGDVIVNEVLAHAVTPAVDAIELHNPTGSDVDVGGWYLSDTWGWDSEPDNGDYRKFRIPDGTVVPAGGYVSFAEGHYAGDVLQFDPVNEYGGTGPKDFALDGSADGHLYLIEADGSGRLLRFADQVELMPAVPGESFGRWPNGTGGLYPQAETSLGDENAGPRVGPVVISEVMYHPPAGGDEFIELFNSADEPVPLYDPEHPEHTWSFGDGVQFVFPAGVSLPGGGTCLVVAIDPAAFRVKYGVPASVPIFGPYGGALDNGGETLRLMRPGAPAGDPPSVPRRLADEVRYDDAGGWPTEADGSGPSLNRREAGLWGNAAASWLAGDPSPGTVPFQQAAAEIVGRFVFYNRSSFDGNNPVANAADDAAIATDKTALRPGHVATSANYTSYSLGINGLMVDVAGAAGQIPGQITTDDFLFRVGNSADTSSWNAAPEPTSVTVRAGAGTGGSDRVTLIWGDHAIKKEWLEVTVLADNLGLLQNDVFFFGNAVAEAGNATQNAQVTTTDLLLARNNPRNFLDPADVLFGYDYNRDGRVNSTDVLLARNNQTNFLTALRLLDLSALDAGLASLASARLSDAPSEDAPSEDARTIAVDRLLAAYLE